MNAEKQCCCVCSLRTGTLFLLWIVMITCGFHIWFITFNHHQSESVNSKDSIVNAKYSAPNVDNTDEKAIIRKKRFLDFLDTIVKAPEEISNVVTNTITNIASTSTQIAGNGVSAFTNMNSNIINSTGKLGSKFQRDVRNFTDQMSKLPNDVLNPIFSSVSKITGNITKPITTHIINDVQDSGIINKVSKQVAEDVGDDIDDRVDKRLNALEIRFQTLFKNFIRYFIRVWSILGVCTSALGIYGIHKNNPRSLRFSDFFFQFSIVTQFLIMSEINIDSSTERKRFLLSELVGIDWRGFTEDWIILINFGIFCSIAISLYFAITVRKCQKMLKEDATNLPT